MKHTGIYRLCDDCCGEYEIFSDDGAGDISAIWNWCPHCGKRQELWMKFWKCPTEDIPVAIGCDEARDKFKE